MPWPKGRPFSLEHRAHMSASAPKTKSPQHVAKLSGQGNGRYKHGRGADPRSRKPWLVVRQQAIARDDNQCQLCGATEDLCGHHINGNEFFSRIDNVITLCRWCHTVVHVVARRLTTGVQWEKAKVLVEFLNNNTLRHALRTYDKVYGAML